MFVLAFLSPVSMCWGMPFRRCFRDVALNLVMHWSAILRFNWMCCVCSYIYSFDSFYFHVIFFFVCIFFLLFNSVACRFVMIYDYTDKKMRRSMWLARVRIGFLSSLECIYSKFNGSVSNELYVNRWHSGWLCEIKSVLMHKRNEYELKNMRCFCYTQHTLKRCECPSPLSSSSSLSWLVLLFQTMSTAPLCLCMREQRISSTVLHCTRKLLFLIYLFHLHFTAKKNVLLFFLLDFFFGYFYFVGEFLVFELFCIREHKSQ